MGAVHCNRCKGSRGHRRHNGTWVDCPTCSGSGINYDLWEVSCRNCYTPIIYKRDHDQPTFCKNCRNIERTKTCEQWGCENTVRYKLGWSTVPNYCGHCQKMRASGASARTCDAQKWSGTCGKLIWVPSGKNYTKCRECGEREQAERAQKWREKSCTGFGGNSCRNTIMYNVDWEKVPDLCPSCINKAKAKREEDRAKWKEKPCAGGCGTNIKYNVDWEHPPNMCKACKEKQRSQPVQRNESKPWTYGLPRETQQVRLSDGTKVTFGPCTEPSPSARGSRAEEQRRFAQSGYWFVSFTESKDHTTFIVRDDDATVVKIKARGADKDIWRTLAIAIR